ncbi:hypothetical protein DPV78_000704 [Talaromyces pinophilus]|nr:hypothetical protein DPV78_000704 [Talaromyces pinophilus]
MGNSQTKEARSPLSASYRNRSLSDQSRSPYHASRSHRSSRHDLSFLGIGSGSGDREVFVQETRRETKQDREARRQEKERAARLKERERSMKEEHVDGGYLVTQGVYVGTEDFNKDVVRQLMIERRLAPFWRGLNDFSESWTEHQLIAAARGLPIPPPDEIPPELQFTPPAENTDGAASSGKSAQFLTVPSASGRPLSAHSETSSLPALSPAQSLPSPTSPIASGTSTSPLFRSRAKTLAALTGSKKDQPGEVGPREIMLTHDPFVNGQPLEAHLYKDASECPICFLYYPPYLNRTRCCDQPICSECFVQIKRPDPHPPEHGEPQDQTASAENGSSEERSGSDQENQLVSEPSACPFCVQPEFGVTYAPPPFRRGLAYAGSNGLGMASATSPLSSSSSLGSMASPPITGRRRATSLSASDPTVITTDKVRPDWATKLANARAHAARRSAAATALHTAAYLMNAPGSETRSFGRRGVLGRARGTSSGTQTPSSRPTGSPALHALAFLSERRAVTGEQPNSTATAGNTEGGALAPPRDSSRRSRIEDLEEMMMMEAIRMSLASEEERRRKEEKGIRKEAKKREKEAKKAEKIMRKNAGYSNSQASLALRSSGTSSRVDSSSSSIMGEEATSSDKGKKVDRTASVPTVTSSNNAESADANATSARQLLSRTDSDSFTQPSPTEPSRPSHLRHMSTASSTSSSFETGTAENPDSGEGSSNPALEPMFNFRSLAAVIGDEEKANGVAEHAEHVEDATQQQSSTTSIPTISKSPPIEDQNSTTSPMNTQSPIPSQDPVHSIAPKELNAHSVEVSRETTV